MLLVCLGGFILESFAQFLSLSLSPALAINRYIDYELIFRVIGGTEMQQNNDVHETTDRLTMGTILIEPSENNDNDCVSSRLHCWHRIYSKFNSFIYQPFNIIFSGWVFTRNTYFSVVFTWWIEWRSIRPAFTVSIDQQKLAFHRIHPTVKVLPLNWTELNWTKVFELENGQIRFVPFFVWIESIYLEIFSGCLPAKTYVAGVMLWM